MIVLFATLRSTLLSAIGVGVLCLLVSVSIAFACPNWIGTKWVPGGSLLHGGVMINGQIMQPAPSGIDAVGPSTEPVCVLGLGPSGRECVSTAPSVGAPVSQSQTTTVTPDGDTGGAAVPDPAFSISAQPLLVRSGGSSTITWSAENVENCTVTGPNFSAAGSNGSQTVNDISQRSTYTLQCTAQSDGSTVEDSVTVTVAPTWQEF